MTYDLNRRIILFKKYYKFENISAVQSAYRMVFKEKTAPDGKVILNIVSTFEKTGWVSRPSKKSKEISEKRVEAKFQPIEFLGPTSLKPT